MINEGGKISVIMSAYNAESTIERAIKSVENSTYSNIEIVVCDDCSTDSTRNIVKQLMDIYDNIILVEHDRNCGAGMARRSGIEHSTGDFIAFVDSDDEVYNDYYATLYEYIQKYDADIVWSTPLILHSCTEKKKPHVLSAELHVGGDIVKKNIDRKKWLNGTISRKECWKEIQYSSLRYIEDTPTMYRLLHYCNKGVLLDYMGYYYYQNPNSICHTAGELKRRVYRMLCMIEILEFDEKFTGKYDKRAFVTLFKELGDSLKVTPYKELVEYKKELFRIFQFFILKII